MTVRTRRSNHMSRDARLRGIRHGRRPPRTAVASCFADASAAAGTKLPVSEAHSSHAAYARESRPVCLDSHQSTSSRSIRRHRCQHSTRYLPVRLKAKSALFLAKAIDAVSPEQSNSFLCLSLVVRFRHLVRSSFRGGASRRTRNDDPGLKRLNPTISSLVRPDGTHGRPRCKMGKR